jgi:hypothetical protein
MKTAIYVRVSTNRQTQAQTIDQQLERLRRHLDLQGELLSADNMDLLQIAREDEGGSWQVQWVYTAIPKRLWMKWYCPTTSPLRSHRICPFRIRCIAS